MGNIGVLINSADSSAVTETVSLSKFDNEKKEDSGNE